MNSRNRLLVLTAGIVLLAGCQSLDTSTEEAESDLQPEPAAVEQTIRVAMTLPRPGLPQSEPLALERLLPEPGVPALPESLSFSQPNPDGYIPDVAPDPPLRLDEPEDPPPAEVAPAAARPRATSPSLTPPAGESEAKVARAPTAATPPGSQAAAPATAAPATAAPELPLSTSSARPAPRQSEVGAVERKLVARRGDPIAVDLEGSGWIYTGLRSGGVPDSGEQKGIDFLSRRNSQNRTSFNFKAVDYGDYELTFQYQDHEQAVLRSQVVHLLVVPDQDFTAALEQQQALSIQPESVAVGFEPVPGPPIASADALFDLGEYDLALIEYKRNIRSGDPYLNDRLAECYARTGEHLAAAKYYRENLGLEGEYGDRAAVGLVRSSIATRDSRLLLEVLPSLFSLESVQIGGELLEIARFQTEDRRYSVALQALEQYVSRYPDGRNLDEVYYRLARIYEIDSPYRDLESARHYYSLLYESFPESLYADPAAERLNYLDRHFFLVQ